MDKESKAMLKDLYSMYLDLGGDILVLKALLADETSAQAGGLTFRFSKECVAVCIKRVQNCVQQHTEELMKQTQEIIRYTENRAGE